MRLQRLRRNRTCRGAVVGFLCGAICWFFNDSAVVRNLENWALDSCFVLRGVRSGEAPIVIVEIDDVALREISKPLMYFSPELATVVQHVRAQGAKAVGIDVLVPKSKDTFADLLPGGIGDAAQMGSVINSDPKVILPELFLPSGELLGPVEEWRRFPSRSTDFGFVNMTTDPDMYMRRQQLRAADEDGASHASLPLAVFAAAQYDDPESWLSAAELRHSGRAIPLDADGRLTINYRGPTGTIPRVPFTQVLAEAAKGGPANPRWQNSMVLIGVTSGALPDRHATPYMNQSLTRLLTAWWAKHPPQLMPGVEIHANTLATLADGQFITTPWWLATPWLLLAVGSGLGVFTVRMSLERGAILAFIHHWGWKVVCAFLFVVGHWQVEMVSMLVLGVLTYAVVFALRWRWVRQMMGMVKSEAVARALEADPEKLDLKGELREITVLFADIRDFTTYSEKHAPQDVVAMLNAYFAAVVPAIEARGGIVNQYIGDGIMAIFNAPERLPHHASAAVHAAQEMVELVHARQSLWEQLDAPAFRIGVGVHTGRATLGTIGSPQRLDYTAIGDTVNTSARIESANKELGTEVLISQATYELLEEPLDSDVLALVQDYREIAVKGRQQPVRVYPLASVPAKAVGEPIMQS